jgi:hypothetical protein
MKILPSIRRLAAVIIALIPFVCAWSGSIANYLGYHRKSIFFKALDFYHIIPIGALVLGGFIIICNVCLLIHPLIYKLRHGSMDGYKHDSGIPLVGTLLILFYSIIKFPQAEMSIYLTIFLLADMTGPLWFVIFTWKDKSLWEGNVKWF